MTAVPGVVGRGEEDEGAPTFAAPGAEGALEPPCGVAVGTMDGGETGNKVA